MAEEEKLSGKVGLDTTDFKTNLAAMNSELRAIDSGFRSSAAALGDWANDATGLEMRVKTLNSSIDIQRQKVEAVRTEYERVKAEKGANSKAAQELESKLNKETATLENMESELGQTKASLNQMTNETKKSGNAIEQAANKFNLFRTIKSTLDGITTTIKNVISGLFSMIGTLAKLILPSALESGVKSLSSQIETQKNKVLQLQEAYGKLASENGVMSKEALDAEEKLKTETGTLNKLERQLFLAETASKVFKDKTQEAGEATEEAGDQAEEAEPKFEGFKNVLGGMGSIIEGTITVAAGLAVAVAGIGAAIGGLVFSSAHTAAELVDLSAKTGISTTRLQELAYIGDQVGTSSETMTGSLARLTRSMAAAQEQQAKFDAQLAEGKMEDEINVPMDMAAAFNSLGVAFTDSNGKLRDSETVFTDAITALGGIENPAERDALAMSIFGKSAMELNPLIKAGSGEMARLADEAHKVGAVMSEEDVASLEAFDDTLASLKAGLKGTLGTLATAFLPGFQSVFGQVGGYLQQFSEIVSGSNGDFGKIAKGLTGLITKIATDLAQQAPQMLQAGLAIVKSILDAIIAALPSMLTAGTEILTSLITFIVQALPQLLQAGIQILLMLVNAIIQNLPMLIDAALQAIIALANGLADALPTLIPAVVQAIITIVMTLIDNIPMLIDAALQLILGLAEGLIAAIPILIPALPKIVQAIVNALIQALPMIGDAAVKLILMLVTGIVQNLPMIGKTAVQLVNVLVRGVLDLATKLIDVGANIVVGVWNGIKAKKDWFYAQIKDFFKGLIDQAKKALGMSSPSKEGMDIGENFVTSPILGAQKQLRNVERYFSAAFGRMATAAAGGMASPGSSSVQNTDQFAFYAPVYFQGATNQLGEKIKARRF